MRRSRAQMASLMAADEVVKSARAGAHARNPAWPATKPNRPAHLRFLSQNFASGRPASQISAK
jgi:hypothetical protein